LGRGTRVPPLKRAWILEDFRKSPGGRIRSGLLLSLTPVHESVARTAKLRIGSLGMEGLATIEARLNLSAPLIPFPLQDRGAATFFRAVHLPHLLEVGADVFSAAERAFESIDYEFNFSSFRVGAIVLAGA